MVLARIVEPTSKAEVVRVLEEIGAPGVSVRTLFRSLARSRARDYRGMLATAARAHSVRTAGTAALVLYDVTTLHFERDDEDDLRKVGMSKEHRIDPQVQAGLLVDSGGFPLEVHLFEGNKAETTTLIPVLTAFAARQANPSSPSIWRSPSPPASPVCAASRSAAPAASCFIPPRMPCISCAAASKASAPRPASVSPRSTCR